MNVRDVPSRRVAAAVFAVALALRLCAIASVSRTGFETDSADSRAYHQIAVNLIEHQRFGNTSDPPHRADVPAVNRFPLLAFSLAAAYAVGGPSRTTGQLLMAIVGSAAAAALYILSFRLFGSTIGLTAGVLAAVYPFFIFLTLVPLTESLAILLYPWVALRWLEVARDPSRGSAATLGLVLGLAALNKPAALGLVPLFVLWAIVWFGRRPSTVVAQAVIVTSLVGLCLAPWIIRNQIAFGTWLNPVGWQDVHMGMSPATNYALDRLEGGEASGWRYDPAYGVEFAGLDPAQSEERARELAVAFVQQEPSAAWRLAARKVRIFWMAYDHPVHRWSWYLIAAAAVAGLTLTASRWKELLPITLLMVQTALLPIFFTSMPRFRAPIEPFLLIFAAYALVATAKLARPRQPLPS